jgi:hypothetical protein
MALQKDDGLRLIGDNTSDFRTFLADLLSGSLELKALKPRCPARADTARYICAP